MQPVCCCVIVPIHTNRLCCCYSGVGIGQEIQHMCSPKTTLAQTLKKVSTYRNMAAPATYLKNRPLTGVNTPLESVPFPVSCRGDGFFGSDSQPLKWSQSQRLGAASTRTTEVSRDPYVAGNVPTGPLSATQKKAREKTLWRQRKKD